MSNTRAVVVAIGFPSKNSTTFTLVSCVGIDIGDLPGGVRFAPRS